MSLHGARDRSVDRSSGTSPAARLLASLLLLAACLLSSPNSLRGLLVAGIAMTTCLILLRVKIIQIGKSALAAIVVYLPLFLATPPEFWLKSAGSVLIAIATYLSLGPADLQKAIRTVPLPHIVRLLALQIIHQTGELQRETVRIARTIAVRGGTSGIRCGVQLARSVPHVWLPRVLFKAERVAFGMELRGYTAASLALPREIWTLREWVMILVGAVVLAGSIASQV